MKKLFLLLFLSPLSFAQEPFKDLEFDLSCTVTAQALIQTKDGKGETYSAYDGGLKNGDTFEIKFLMNFSDDLGYELGITVQELMIFETLSSLESMPTEYKNGLEYSGEDRLFDGMLNIETFMGDMNLRRYYKNDYELIAADGLIIGNPVRSLTANCMNMPSEFDESFEYIKLSEKIKWGDKLDNL